MKLKDMILTSLLIAIGLVLQNNVIQKVIGMIILNMTSGLK